MPVFFWSTPQWRQNPVSQLDLNGADAPEDKNNSSIFKMLSNKELGWCCLTEKGLNSPSPLQRWGTVDWHSTAQERNLGLVMRKERAHTHHLHQIPPQMNSFPSFLPRFNKAQYVQVLHRCRKTKFLYNINIIFDPYICSGYTAELKFDFCISIQGTWGWVGDSVEVCKEGGRMMLGPYGDIVGKVGQ